MRRRRKVRQNKTSTAGLGISSLAQLVHPRELILRSDGTEPKFFDAATITVANWNGTVTKISGITQGVGVSQRIGDSADLIGLEVRYSARPSAAADTHRIVIVQMGLDDSAAAITPGTICSGALFGTADAPLSLFNFSAIRQRDFAVLLDEVIEVGPGLNDSKHWVHPLRSRIAFDAGLITGNGHIYVLTFSTAAAVITNGALICRVFYKDA